VPERARATCTCERARVINFLRSQISFFPKKFTRSPRRTDDGVNGIANGNARTASVWNVRRTTTLHYYYHSSGENETVTVASRAGGRSVGDAILRIPDEPQLVRKATTTTEAAAAAVNAQHKYNLRPHSRPL